MSLNDSIQVFVSRMDGITAFLDEGEAPSEKQCGVILKWVEELRLAQLEARTATVTAVRGFFEPVGGAHTTALWRGKVKEALMAQCGM